MRNALVIGMDESLEVIDLGKTTEESSEVLKNAVDGLYQTIDLKRDLTMWVNEEGKLDGLMTNSIATAIFQAKFGMIDIIVGNAVLTGGVDDEGETIGLTEPQVEQLTRLFTK